MAKNPNPSLLDPGQIIKRVYDEANDQLRTTIDASINIGGQQTLVIDQVADSIVVYGTTDGTFSGTHKAIKVDSSGVVQVSATVPGTITVNQGTNPWVVSGTISASNPSVSTTGSTVPSQATFVGGTDGTNLRALKVSSAGVLSVDGSASTQPISGTITANAGTGIFSVDVQGLATFQTSQYTVGTSAIQLTVIPFASRTSVSIKVKGTTSDDGVYIGNSSGVTSSTGYALFDGDGLVLDLVGAQSIYAIGSSAGQIVYVLEGAHV